MSSSENATSATSRGEPWLILAACVVVAIFVAGSLWFASSQAIWIDETTQLAGLSLSPSQQLQWLAGELPTPGGVPPDRNPPLSYLLGDIWVALIGSGELQLRIAGIAAFLAAVPAVWLAGRRLGSSLGAFFALALVFLSPAMIVQAVEIRPYPLFFALSCWALWAYVEVIAHETSPKWRLVTLTAILIAASYTHFYGIVLSFCVMASLLVFSVVQRRSIVAVLLAGVAYGVAILGLVPFVLGGAKVSGAATPVQSLGGIVKGMAKLAYRLAFHGVHLALTTPVVLLAAAALALLGLLAIGAQRKSARLFALAPLVVALVVLPLTSLVVRQFNVLAPHYNLWMVPGAAIFLAAAFASRFRSLALAGGAVVIATQLAATAILVQNPEPWTHGPGEWLVSQISEPAHTLIIHDGTTSDWAHGYFPIRYLTAGSVTQLLRDADGNDRVITPSGEEPLPAGFSERAYDKLILVRIRAMDSETLASRASDEIGCGFSAPAPRPDEETGRLWEERDRCAFAAAAVRVGVSSQP